MIIKRMTEDTVSAVAELEAEVFSVPWSRQGFADTLTMENVIFLTAMEDEELLGYCGIYLAADEGEITNVAVSPKYRRRGVAKALVQQVMDMTRTKGIRTYILEVRASNEGALRLYEGLGFVRSGLRKDFYEKPREDAVVMVHQ